MTDEFKFAEDICAHAGEDYSKHYGAMGVPIFQTSLFVQGENVNEGFIYSRVDNPTTRIVEEKIALLEKGDRALCFASGMAAISTAIISCVKSNDHIIMVKNSYSPTKHFTEYMSKFGIEVTFVDGDEVSCFENALKENTSLIYLESPSTFVMRLQPLAEVAHLAKSKGIRTIVDNTWSTPLYQNPLSFGIDLVVHSASKYLGGHSDLVGGVIVGKGDLIEHIYTTERQQFGGIMDPHLSWLLLRGIRTLPIRMERHQHNAMKIAHFLESSPYVDEVFYPGLESHPQYTLAKKQMLGFSGLLSFTLNGTVQQNEIFLNNITKFYVGVSWGGYDSLISGVGIHLTDELSLQMCIPKALVRLSVGLENVETLLEDLENALQRSRQ